MRKLGKGVGRNETQSALGFIRFRQAKISVIERSEIGNRGSFPVEESSPPQADVENREVEVRIPGAPKDLEHSVIRKRKVYRTCKVLKVKMPRALGAGKFTNRSQNARIFLICPL